MEAKARIGNRADASKYFSLENIRITGFEKIIRKRATGRVIRKAYLKTSWIK